MHKILNFTEMTIFKRIYWYWQFTYTWVRAYKKIEWELFQTCSVEIYDQQFIDSSSSSPWFCSCCKGPWLHHTGNFVILLGLHWTSELLFSKDSTYTGQHNTETQRQTSMPRAGFKHTIPVTKRPRPVRQTALPPGPAQFIRYPLWITND
jgi:hypothetical protein